MFFLFILRCNFSHTTWYVEVDICPFIFILSVDSDTHTLQAKEINEKNAELEANCKKLTEQLSVLSNDSQSAKDVNLKLVEQIDHLKELVAMKG